MQLKNLISEKIEDFYNKASEEDRLYHLPLEFTGIKNLIEKYILNQIP